MKKLFCYLLVTGALCLTAPFIAVAQEVESGTDALQLVEKTRKRELLLDTHADWSRYSKFTLDSATVAFRKNWARDLRNRTEYRPTEETMDQIKTSLSELLGEVLTHELTKNGGLTASAESGGDVMRITPHIVDLDVYAPDRMRDFIGYTLTDSSGHMTINLEIHDSVSGALLAQASDYREDPQKGYLEWSNSVSNRQAARLLLQRWAKNVRKWLENAREGDFDS